MGHVKSRVNQRGPPRKAKYFWMTDSETVPRGKGEKEPLEGSEIEHETVSCQAVGDVKKNVMVARSFVPTTIIALLYYPLFA